MDVMASVSLNAIFLVCCPVGCSKALSSGCFDGGPVLSFLVWVGWSFPEGRFREVPSGFTGLLAVPFGATTALSFAL